MTESPVQPAENNETDARHHLFALLYEELRRIAHRELQRAVGVATLSPTTLLPRPPRPRRPPGIGCEN